MNKKSNLMDIKDRRLLTIKEAAAYCGIGYTNARKWFREIGAVRRFGRSVLIDRIVIDRALDSAAADVDLLHGNHN
ncbi:MAG: DUF6462 family protein [Bilifractor sp.]